MKNFVAGNWKMNGLLSDYSQVEKINQAYGDLKNTLDAALFVPALLMGAWHDKPLDLPLGLQDCHIQDSGAFTGNISAKMIADMQGRYVIVGHSERREYHFETSEIIAKKAENAHKHNIISVICVGETLNDYQAGNSTDYVMAQIDASMPAGATADNTIIAYEPIWAIGTGLTPTESEIANMHNHIYQRLVNNYGADVADKMRLLYGGSVNDANAKMIASVPYVHGALVGGASLTADKFIPIMHAFA